LDGKIIARTIIKTLKRISRLEIKKSFSISPFGKGGESAVGGLGGFSAEIFKSPLTPLYERGEFLDPSFRWDDNGG
jgi:hypothetical protein